MRTRQVPSEAPEYHPPFVSDPNAGEPIEYLPEQHYDRVTESWRFLLGDDLHYGVFDAGDEDLPTATHALTNRMTEAAGYAPGLDVLDVGCGTGSPACHLAEQFDVRVLGITTSSAGVTLATARAAERGLSDLARFERRDGTDNGLPDASFDRVWVLESSHLMRDRDALMDECARVLKPGGRMVLCDITLQRELPFMEVRRLRQEFALLRAVFGDAHMQPLSQYAAMARDYGLEVERQVDLTQATLPTFDRWRTNALHNRDRVIELVGERYLDDFVGAADVLEAFWRDGTLGYGLLAAVRP
jgi:cyclopropane fatty-acyl-phospholipid synthase-like methyltransferase